MSSILSDYRIHDLETNRLLRLCRTLNTLEPTHQKLVAEIVLLRLFSLFENIISSICMKLVSGANYVDGSSPTLMVRARSSKTAIQLFQSYGRIKPRGALKWSKSGEIKDNLRYVINPTDNIITVVDRHGVHIDELRRVRNRIAHNNVQSRNNYQQVVRKHYGAYLNHVTPGMLLLTPRIKPSLLEQFIKQQRIVIKDAVKA